MDKELDDLLQNSQHLQSTNLTSLIPTNIQEISRSQIRTNNKNSRNSRNSKNSKRSKKSPGQNDLLRSARPSKWRNSISINVENSKKDNGQTCSKLRTNDSVDKRRAGDLLLSKKDNIENELARVSSQEINKRKKLIRSKQVQREIRFGDMELGRPGKTWLKKREFLDLEISENEILGAKGRSGEKSMERKVENIHKTNFLVGDGKKLSNFLGITRTSGIPNLTGDLAPTKKLKRVFDSDDSDAINVESCTKGAAVSKKIFPTQPSVAKVKNSNFSRSPRRTSHGFDASVGNRDERKRTGSVGRSINRKKEFLIQDKGPKLDAANGNGKNLVQKNYGSS
jgi:hypothetical protein